MTEQDKNSHINAAIGFTDLVRTTLGPRGMNKMIVGKNGLVLTNDGATIVGNLPAGNPILDLFKNLAKSQELEVGDGTTTALIISGQLLQNAVQLINKGLHPTTIISGYNIATIECLKFLEENKKEGDKEKIIRTAFGTKMGIQMIDHLTKILLKVKDFEKLKSYKIDNSNPFESEIYKGFVFPGYTINERMKSEINGIMAVLDFPTQIQAEGNATTAKEMLAMNQAQSDYKKQIIDKLLENNVSCVFYTDTSPELETYLTDAGITGIVIIERDKIDGICKATGCKAASSLDRIEGHTGKGVMKYVKQKIGNRGHIYLEGNMETLVLKGPTSQVLDEMERSVHDVISLMKNKLDIVVGAGAIEIELANHMNEIARKIGGKEQLAIEKFAEALESIPMILAENCGLDAIEVLTNLKTFHSNGMVNIGVDLKNGVSDAKERGIIEPALVKAHAINSANNVATLILKLDQILQGKENESNSTT